MNPYFRTKGQVFSKMYLKFVILQEKLSQGPTKIFYLIIREFINPFAQFSMRILLHLCELDFFNYEKRVQKEACSVLISSYCCTKFFYKSK